MSNQSGDDKKLPENHKKIPTKRFIKTMLGGL
jgi:hypothetical protein